MNQIYQNFVTKAVWYVIGDRKSSIAPLANYKWKHTADAIQSLTAFDPDPYDGYAVEYINPSNGRTANPTMAAWMQYLPSGLATKAHRHNHSTIYQVKEGEGYSIINGVRFDIEQEQVLDINNGK